MSARRSTPERLDIARRAALVARLIGEGELPDRAERLVAAAEAAWDGPRDDAGRWAVLYRRIVASRT